VFAVLANSVNLLMYEYRHGMIVVGEAQEALSDAMDVRTASLLAPALYLHLGICDECSQDIAANGKFSSWLAEIVQNALSVV
jgi:hypothetical protein